MGGLAFAQGNRIGNDLLMGSKKGIICGAVFGL
jgi:hypothetical protein